MAAIYMENPHNFSDIEAHVLVEKEEIQQEILLKDKLYFYDTCSFRKHIYMQNPDYLFEFIKRNKGVVIIIRCILMELASHSGILNPEYIDYIKKMQGAGLKVLVIYEEDLFDVLSRCFSTNTVINNFLSWAVKTVKRPTSTIDTTLKADRNLLDSIIKGNATEGTLFQEFFQSVKSNKESGDNLGEELIAVCMHLLANIPDSKDYKYVVLTEDKGAIGLINKTSKNVYEHIGKYALSALTTARLAQRLYEENIIFDKIQVEEILSAGAANTVIKILGSEEYDLEIKEKVMTCSELAEKIVTSNAIHINY